MKRLVRIFAVLCAVALLAVGCAGSGDPEDYSAETETNFVEACEEGNSGDSAVVSADTAVFCQCTYSQIEANMAFEDFKEVDDLLDKNAGDTILALDQLPSVADDYLAAIATCTQTAE